jgi:spermidine/putrescine transport system permease protein
MYGVDNSTYGNIYTIIGLVYLYVPFMIMPIYSVLIDMPNNLINASHDLGHSGTSTFFKIVVPYTKTALISGITLVFLPTITTVAVPQFLNNANNGTLIGDIIVDEGQQGLTSDIALARASTLSLVLCGVLIGGYVLFRVSYSRISRHFKKQKVKAYA